jgi:hypothetical protein
VFVYVGGHTTSLEYHITQPPYIYFSTFIQDRLFSIFILLDYVQERVGFDGVLHMPKEVMDLLFLAIPLAPLLCCG